MSVWAGGLVEVWVENNEGNFVLSLSSARHGGLEKDEHVGWLFGWDLG